MDGRVTTKKENDCKNTEDTTMTKQSDDDTNIDNNNNNITAFFTHLLDNKNMGSMLSKIDVVIVSDNAKSQVNNSIPQNRMKNVNEESKRISRWHNGSIVQQQGGSSSSSSSSTWGNNHNNRNITDRSISPLRRIEKKSSLSVSSSSLRTKPMQSRSVESEDKNSSNGSHHWKELNRINNPSRVKLASSTVQVLPVILRTPIPVETATVTTTSSSLSKSSYISRQLQQQESLQKERSSSISPTTKTMGPLSSRLRYYGGEGHVNHGRHHSWQRRRRAGKPSSLSAAAAAAGQATLLIPQPSFLCSESRFSSSPAPRLLSASSSLSPPARLRSRTQQLMHHTTRRSNDTASKILRQAHNVVNHPPLLVTTGLQHERSANDDNVNNNNTNAITNDFQHDDETEKMINVDESCPLPPVRRESLEDSVEDEYERVRQDRQEEKITIADDTGFCCEIASTYKDDTIIDSTSTNYNTNTSPADTDDSIRTRRRRPDAPPLYSIPLTTATVTNSSRSRGRNRDWRLPGRRRSIARQHSAEISPTTPAYQAIDTTTRASSLPPTLSQSHWVTIRNE